MRGRRYGRAFRSLMANKFDAATVVIVVVVVVAVAVERMRINTVEIVI